MFKSLGEHCFPTTATGFLTFHYRMQGGHPGCFALTNRVTSVLTSLFRRALRWCGRRRRPMLNAPIDLLSSTLGPRR